MLDLDRQIFTLNGEDVICDKVEEKLIRPSTGEVYTVHQFLQTFYPDYKSHSQKVFPPPEINKIGFSGRFKIVRAVQNHFMPPPITPEIKELVPVFDFFANGDQKADSRRINRQCAIANWATNYDFEKTVSLIFHNGLLNHNRYLREPIEYPALYQIEQTPSGIHLVIDNFHTLQERCVHTCDSLVSRIVRNKIAGIDQTRNWYIGFAMKEFYGYQNILLTLNSDRIAYIKAALIEYIDKALFFAQTEEYSIDLSNKISDGIEIPDIREPEVWAPPYDRLFKWEEFKIINGDQVHTKTFMTLCESIAKSPLKPRTVYTRQELLQYIGKTNLNTAKQQNLVENPAWGKYILKDNLFDYADTEIEMEDDSS